MRVMEDNQYTLYCLCQETHMQHYRLPINVFYVNEFCAVQNCVIEHDSFLHFPPCKQ